MKAYKDRSLIGRMTALLSCLLLFSCNNEDFFGVDEGGCAGKYGDNICFSISSDGDVGTRGAAGMKDRKEESACHLVLRAANVPDTLCVRTIISDGINASPFTGEAPVTRSAPITSLETYGSFHVQAHCREEGSLVNTFYMNDDVKNRDGDVWRTDKVYYWPGATRTLQFYAWAPSSAKGLSVPSSPGNTTLTYTVPAAVSDQQDLVVANTGEMEGNSDRNVSLTFRHICTAVRFEIGSQMQPGSIKSVTLKGVKTTGTYDMSTDTWTLTEASGDYTQELDKTMNGSETPGSEVTTDAQTFMMLPQENLPAEATVEVVFADQVTGNERTLSASIAGMEWPQGKTVTYRISITPEYDMSIKCETYNVDAHVDIQQIQIEADGPWVLSSDVDWLTFTDWSYDTSKPEERPLGYRGYWIRSERGNKTFSGSGNMTLYAYYDENLGNESRTANITLTYPETSIVGAQAPVTQYCPAWSGNAGYERFEEDHRWEEDGSKTFTYPFGFAWDRKVEFTAEPKVDIWNFSLRDLLGAYVFFYIANNAIENYGASDYVTVNEESAWWSLGLTYKTTVTIDYSNFNAIGNLVTPDDGLTNTRNLYGFQNIGQVSAIENVLRDNAVGNFNENVINDSHGNIPVDQFAARRIAMKNEFQKVLREEIVQGETIRYYEAVIDVNDIHWYLPASNEQVSLKAGLTEGDEPLEGEYWSSTAVSDNTNAYKYTPDGTLNPEDRMVPHKMRAAVRKSN